MTTNDDDTTVGYSQESVISLLKIFALVLRYRAKLTADAPEEAAFRQNLRQLLDECGKKSDFCDADSEHYRILIQLFWEYYEAHDKELPDSSNPPLVH